MECPYILPFPCGRLRNQIATRSKRMLPSNRFRLDSPQESASSSFSGAYSFDSGWLWFRRRSDCDASDEASHGHRGYLERSLGIFRSRGPKVLQLRSCPDMLYSRSRTCALRVTWHYDSLPGIARWVNVPQDAGQACHDLEALAIQAWKQFTWFVTGKVRPPRRLGRTSRDLSRFELPTLTPDDSADLSAAWNPPIRALSVPKGRLP